MLEKERASERKVSRPHRHGINAHGGKRLEQQLCRDLPLPVFGGGQDEGWCEQITRIDHEGSGTAGPLLRDEG